MKKEKVRLFQRISFDDPEWARKVYDRENEKFKFKTICTIISLLTPMGWWIWSWEITAGGVLEVVVSLFVILGWGATIISSPGQVFKTLFTLAKIGWCIVPFVFFDLIGIVFGLALGLCAFLCVPTAYCAIGLYQSYLNRKAAEAYLALGDMAK